MAVCRMPLPSTLHAVTIKISYSVDVDVDVGVCGKPHRSTLCIVKFYYPNATGLLGDWATLDGLRITGIAAKEGLVQTHQTEGQVF
jgi:hypothetical protein